MDNLIKSNIARFDQVRLVTTKNVSYLSSPPGTTVDPHGIWSVTGIVGESELLLAKESTLIKIPAADVLKVMDYDINKITQELGNLSNGQERKREETGKPGQID